VPKNITVPVTSDRGLCGGINSGIAKATFNTQKVVAAMGSAGETPNGPCLAIAKGVSRLSLLS
jgi:hypothetical protein